MHLLSSGLLHSVRKKQKHRNVAQINEKNCWTTTRPFNLPTRHIDDSVIKKGGQLRFLATPSASCHEWGSRTGPLHRARTHSLVSPKVSVN